MTGHAIEAELSPGGWHTLRPVCLEPDDALCRLTCPGGCEIVKVDRNDGLRCASCGVAMEPLPRVECHVVSYLDNSEELYGGTERRFLIPVCVDWTADGARWRLPDDPTATEVTR